MTSKAFLLGSDIKQREFVEWMLKQLHDVKTNVEIIIADYCGGLSDLPATTFSVKRPNHLKGWYIKPYAIHQAHQLGFEQVCWLDNDLEIIQNIDHIFDYSEENKLGLVPDGFANRRSRYPVWNSGVVLSDNSPSILSQWMIRCSEQKERGDQEALAYLLNCHSELKPQLFNLPESFN